MKTTQDRIKDRRIIVIEPSDSVRLAMKLHFEQKGAIVLSIGRVEKITTVISGCLNANENIDVILVDVRLPNCFAFYVLKKINEALMGRRVPVFVVSSGFGDLAIRQMLNWKVKGYIKKPCRMVDLEAFLRNRLEFFAEKIAADRESNDWLQQRIDRRKMSA